QRVGNVNVARAVDCDGSRSVELRTGGLAAIAGESGNAVAGDGSDGAAAEVNAADAVVARVGDVELAGNQGDPGGAAEQGAGCGPVVATESDVDAARDGGDDAASAAAASGSAAAAPAAGDDCQPQQRQRHGWPDAESQPTSAHRHADEAPA